MWLDAFRTVVDNHPERIAIQSDRGACTYAQLLSLCRARAEALAAAPPRQAIVDVHPLDTLVDVIGCWLAGRTPAVLHRSIPPATLATVQNRLQQPLPERIRRAGRPPEQLILTTSGSTGIPKLVGLPLGAVDASTAVLVDWYGLPDDTPSLVASSLSRSGELINSALPGLAQGWTLHAFAEGAPHPVLQAHVRHHEIRMIRATPSFFRLFFAFWNGQHFPSPVHITSGAELTPPALAKQLLAAFPNALVYQAYGLTECSGRISAVRCDDPRAADGAIGPAMPHMEWQLRPVDAIAPPAGEIYLRGPSVCLGYLSDDGGYEGLDDDGWMRTRDLVRVEPDGCFMHRGRADAFIKTGGFLVNPLDAVRTLNALPGVAESRCLPVPHHVLGHVLAAEIVPLPGAILDPVELRRHCLERLESYQVPREFRFVEQLEALPLGKTAMLSPPPSKFKQDREP